MSARARNAARRVALIAAVGGAAVIGTMLVLVLLPREVDRAIRAQLDAIPAARDSAPLLSALAGAQARHALAEDMARRSRVVAAASPVTSMSNELTAAADSAALARDSLGAELQQRLIRARGAPLVESYRALADSRLLRDDSRIRAIVDSIEEVDREREAYAALGGPDARYATLTARLSALGQRVVRVGESALAQRRAVIAPRPPSGAAGGAPAPGGDTSAGVPTPPPVVIVVDSALVAAAAVAADTVRAVEGRLDALRRTNDSLEARRAAVRELRGLSIPPLAMLGAALIVGLALGYGTAVVRELRRPTVGDEGEVERLAQARVVVHSGSPEAVRDTRTRRRADRMLPPALDPAADAWQQLHLTLTGLGDVVRTVRVIADQPLLGGTLAINLAAAAARESRATLLIEPPARTPLLALLLRQTKPRGILDVQQGRAEIREVVTEVPVGRDVAVAVLFSGNAPGNPIAALARPDNGDEIRRISARYDLTLVVGDGPDVGVAASDIIICARLGSTSLEWLGRVTNQARADNHRLRAVLLWATDGPTV
jgi:tyrosine-protein kinase Etk/Wzc